MTTVEVWREDGKFTVLYRAKFPKPSGQYLDYVVENSTIEAVENMLPILLKPSSRGENGVPYVGSLRECCMVAEMDAFLDALLEKENASPGKEG